MESEAVPRNVLGSGAKYQVRKSRVKFPETEANLSLEYKVVELRSHSNTEIPSEK